MGVYKYDSTNDELNPIAGSTTYADLAVGSIIPYGGTTPPISFLLCDGLEIPKADYPELYAVIGDAFGSAAEATHFKLPDLRECVPVGVGKNITKSIANHDRYNLGQFKDDELGTHDHPLKTVTTATYNTAGVPVGVAVNNTPTSATHGKQVGVNYIIKAKNTGYPSDIGDAVENLVEDLMDDYQTKDLATPITIGGVSQTTVESALSGINEIVAQQYHKYFASTHDRYVELGTLIYSPSSLNRLATLNILVFYEGGIGQICVDIQSRNSSVKVKGWTDIDLTTSGLGTPKIVLSNENNETCHVYLDCNYMYLFIDMYVTHHSGDFTVGNFSASASVTGTEVFNSTTNPSIVNVQNIISGLSYSTSETKTGGTWIDGKPIYRKCFEVTTPSSADIVTTVASLPTGFEHMVNLYGVIYAPKNEYTLSCDMSSSDYALAFLRVGTNANPIGVAMKVGSAVTSKTAKIVLEYTKTT